jgi:UDP-N-acetylglucosamine acyltransferase
VTGKPIIDPSARIGKDVRIGPWTVIGPDVEIGDGCDIRSHVVIRGPTRIGRNNTIFQFATVGEDPSDLKYRGEASLLEIGDNNVIREGATIHRGTEVGGGVTRIGSDNLFMPYTHVAHDCIIGNHVIFSNNASVAGHVVVDDWVILGGFVGIYQFLHIGAHAFIGAQTHDNMDVPAYMSRASRLQQAGPAGAAPGLQDHLPQRQHAGAGTGRAGRHGEEGTRSRGPDRIHSRLYQRHPALKWPMHCA